MATLRRKQLSAGHLWKKSSMHSYLVAGLTERELGPYSNRPWCLTGKQEMTSKHSMAILTTAVSAEWWGCFQWVRKESKTLKTAKYGQQRRQWHPTPGSSPWGRWESGTNERLHFPFSLACIGEGNGNPLQCSCLESPRDGRAWWAASMGSRRVGHDWSDLAAAASMDKHLKEFCWKVIRKTEMRETKSKGRFWKTKNTNNSICVCW